MAKKHYVRSDWKLPPVDVPDWELVGKIADLLRTYARGGDGGDYFAIEVRDGRGTYSDSEVDEVKAEMATRGEPPESIEVRVMGWEPEVSNHRELSVKMQKDGSSQVLFTSGDEAIVAHCYERTLALFDQAAARREGERSAESAHATVEPKIEASAASPPAVVDAASPPDQAASGKLQRFLYNPWTVTVGGTLLAAGIAVVWLF